MEAGNEPLRREVRSPKPRFGGIGGHFGGFGGHFGGFGGHLGGFGGHVGGFGRPSGVGFGGHVGGFVPYPFFFRRRPRVLVG